MTARKRKELEIDLGHAIAISKKHGDCGCSLCQLAGKTVRDFEGTEQMRIAIQLQQAKQ